jgi:hypothetical protein
MNVYDGHSKLHGRVALVGCSRSKIYATNIPAAQLFTSTAFLAAHEYALDKYDRYFLLSSKYGLLKSEN